MSDRMKIKTAIVTAGAHGLGQAIAQRLASEGVQVAIVDRDESGAAATVNSIVDAGGAAEYWVADCTDVDEIDATVAAITAKFGSIEGLVNNVGGSAGADAAPFHLQTPDVLARVVNQSLMATVLWSRAVVNHLRDIGAGKIVNIASDSAFAGDIHMAEYGAAKAGVVGFTRSLARELSPLHINVNAVAPGPIRTAALDRLSPEVLARAAAQIPLGHLGEPRDIANAVAFMMSDEADFITGQTLVVGGGRWLH